MHYQIATRSDKWVADYAGISLYDVGDLCYYDYLVLLRDAVIFELQKTEGGRKYLTECWMMEQTRPDRKRLKDQFGG